MQCPPRPADCMVCVPVANSSPRHTASPRRRARRTGARSVERGRMRQQRPRWVRDQLVRDRHAGRAVADAPVDELEGARGGGDDLRGGCVADAERVVDGGGGEWERVRF